MGPAEPEEALLQQFIALPHVTGMMLPAVRRLGATSPSTPQGCGKAPLVASGKAAPAEPYRGKKSLFFTLHVPGRGQKATALLFVFCSWQRALPPGWVPDLLF